MGRKALGAPPWEVKLAIALWEPPLSEHVLDVELLLHKVFHLGRLTLRESSSGSGRPAFTTLGFLLCTVKVMLFLLDTRAHMDRCIHNIQTND